MADMIPLLPKEMQDAVLQSPAMMPPNGTVSQFDNPPNNNALAHGVIITCLTIIALCVSLRAYLAVLSKRVKVSEGLILLALAFVIVFTYCMYRVMGLMGFFVHAWDVRLVTIIPVQYWTLVGGIIYSLVLPIIKIAILLEWLAMFVPRGGERNAFWYASVGVIAFQIGMGIATIVSLCLVCTPFEATWDLRVKKERCFPKYQLEWASCVGHLLTDVVMLILPHRIIWGLNMSLKTKIGVSMVFSLGLLAVVSAIMRLQVQVEYNTNPDGTYALGPVAFWVYAEMTCGFVIACLPSAPRLLRETRVLHRIKARLGMKLTTAKASNMSGGSAMNMASKASKPATATDRHYLKIDDDGLAMHDLNGKSESTEHLQREGPGMGSKRDLESGTQHHAVVRTTEVTVKGEYVRPGPDGHQNYNTRQAAAQAAAWQNSGPHAVGDTRSFRGGR